MNRTIGIRIANEIGTTPLVDAPKSGLAWGPFLCIGVNINIMKPLMRGKIVHIENVEERWVSFKYERLPTFCYRCGIPSHQDHECQKIKIKMLSFSG